MSAEKKRPTYLDPNTFEFREYSDALAERLEDVPYLNDVFRRSYTAVIRLSPEEQQRINALKGRMEEAWIGDAPSQLNLSAIQYLLEFAGFKEEELTFLLWVQARHRCLRYFIYDIFDQAFYQLSKDGHYSWEVYRHFQQYNRSQEFFQAFVAEIESREPVILNDLAKLHHFARLAKQELISREEELREKWRTPRWEDKIQKGEVSDEDRQANYYDIVLVSLEEALVFIEKRQDQADTVTGDGYLPPQEWNPDFNNPDWGAGAA